MIDEYVTMCAKLAADIGGELSDEQRAHVRRRLKRRLAEARSASPYSTINIVLIAASGRPVQYKITAHGRTENPYAHSPNTPQSPRFGTEPDARVWALANEAADPAAHRVLDIGAGTGRNALPLARRGHPVDVVEMTPKFADAIRSDAEGEGLDVRVIVADVFSTIDDLRRDYQLILLSGLISGQCSSCAVCSNLPPIAWLLVHAWCSTPSWCALVTRLTRLRVSSGSIFTRVSSRGTRWKLRQPNYPSSSLPMTPYTTTRKRTCPTVPGRPRVGTPIG
jgi:SAM-dependent methyltransferase